MHFTHTPEERIENMQVLYKSTRGTGDKITASQAILKGLSDDGGLFVPDSIPTLDVDLETLSKMNYQEIAYEVMSRFLTDFTEEELKSCIEKAYDSKFDTKEIVPLVKREMPILWNFSMALPLLLRIWHCLSFLIC